MNVFTLVLVLSFTKVLSANVLEDIIKSNFPPRKRCLHIFTESDVNYINILQIFHKNMFPVVNTLTMESEESFFVMHCDDYISECEDKEGLLDYIERLEVLTKNNTNRKNMRFVIFVHKSKDIFINADELNLNILIIQTFSEITEFTSSGFSNTSVGLKVTQPMLIAPLINKTIALNLTTYGKRQRLLRQLFQEQSKYLNLRIINRRQFRISFFECPPFVIYANDKIDGIEYRIISEVAKNWKLLELRRDFSEGVADPWAAVKEDVVSNHSDLAMCSIWLTATNWSAMDFSYEYNSLCSTFLVPKPTLINPSEFLYLPLSNLVWIALVISIIITMTWLYLVASADKLSDSARYASIVYCFMRVIEMATLHGLNNIPRQMSFKIMITFWMVTCILISTAYSSGYTSLLTCPQYGRKIETLKDMVNEGVYWGEILNYTVEEGNDNPHFLKISQRRKQQKSIQELIRNIKTNNYATFVKRLGDDYVTETERYQSVTKYLSCLKECVSQYFIVFALQKNSLYKDFINKRLIELLESGIVRYWQTDIIRKYKTSYMKQFFDDYTNTENEPFSLSISHTRGAFYLLASGLLLSKIIFFNEVLGLIRSRQVHLPVEQ